MKKIGFVIDYIEAINPAKDTTLAMSTAAFDMGLEVFLLDAESMSFMSERKRGITMRNQYFVVEVIRNVAEYCVFGEKIGLSHMDTFTELNCLAWFQCILAQNNKVVNMQLI